MRCSGTIPIMVLPFEIAIEGIPVSQQARRRSRVVGWRESVRDFAERHWKIGDSPHGGPLEVSITYFYDRVPVDVDNLPKPILDALNGLVYEDDSQITDLLSSKRPIGDHAPIESASQTLRRALDLQEPFVHILVEESQSQEVSS